MDPYGNPDRLAISSSYGGSDGRPEQTGIETLNDQTYFAADLNVSCNHKDCAGYLETPDYVTDAYLQALEGGDESHDALRQISEIYGPKDDGENLNINFNHNTHLPAHAHAHSEPCPNQGCGCTTSYNGGAGGGTAVCNDCCERPYEPGFSDKKRDPGCCCDDTYQRGLCNKKPSSCECAHDYHYIPDMPKTPVFCTPSSATCCGPSSSSKTCPPKQQPCCDDTYQKGLCNKKPTESCECSHDFKYVPHMAEPPPYCAKGDKSCCSSCCSYGPPDTYELIKNNDARKYSSCGPSRINFYNDTNCGCNHPRHNGSCNNNYVNKGLDWAQLRKSAYSYPCSNLSYGSPSYSQSYHTSQTSGAPVKFSQIPKATGTAGGSMSAHHQLLSRSPSPNRRGGMEVSTQLARGQKKEEEDDKGQASGVCVIQ